VPIRCGYTEVPKRLKRVLRNTSTIAIIAMIPTIKPTHIMGPLISSNILHHLRITDQLPSVSFDGGRLHFRGWAHAEVGVRSWVHISCRESADIRYNPRCVALMTCKPFPCTHRSFGADHRTESFLETSTRTLAIDMGPNLVIGCGYLGRRVARHWQNQGKRVMALTRGRGNELRGLGIEPIIGDVLDEKSLASLPRAETILYAVALDRTSGRSFREVYLQGLQNVMRLAPPCRRFIYVSSISVYGQSNGEEVDEMSATEPKEENGRIIHEAEAKLNRGVPGAIILRFAGIYGPGRIIRRAAIERGEPLLGDADKWLNLIHVDDGAQAILAAETRGKAGEIYLIADDRPVRRREFYTFTAELLKAPTAVFAPRSTGDPCLPHNQTNRRIANRKMRQELGVNLQYADYRSGLPASI
jgi:nucleoside-diphosphate-sugar epimerase